MATQTFDLSAAMENWRNDLAAQPQFTADDRRELEKHLADSMAELHGRGLNDEESFWLARRRMGQPQQLAMEFEKADPAKVWRERIFWMAVVSVGGYVFTTWKDLLGTWLNQSGWEEVLYLIPLGLLVGSVVMIRGGRIPNHFENISSWKLSFGLLGILVATVAAAVIRSRSLPGNDMIVVGYNIGMVLSWFGNAVWPGMIVLILLLTGKRNRKTRQRA